MRSEILYSRQALEDAAGPRHSKVEVRLSYLVYYDSGGSRASLVCSRGSPPAHQTHSKSLNPVKYALDRLVAGGVGGPIHRS